MKNILVPTDFSPLADAAGEYALKLAAKAKAEIHFLHIQFTPVDWVKLDKEKRKTTRKH
ncbi:MAG: universal stress protein [Owenweeksia sp.]|nr:universal stress protein [Owenweeksia sp.]